MIPNLTIDDHCEYGRFSTYTNTSMIVDVNVNAKDPKESESVFFFFRLK